MAVVYFVVLTCLLVGGLVRDAESVCASPYCCSRSECAAQCPASSVILSQCIQLTDLHIRFPCNDCVSGMTRFPGTVADYQAYMTDLTNKF